MHFHDYLLHVALSDTGAHFKKWCMMQGKIRAGTVKEYKSDAELITNTVRKFLEAARKLDSNGKSGGASPESEITEGASSQETRNALPTLERKVWMQEVHSVTLKALFWGTKMILCCVWSVDIDHMILTMHRCGWIVKLQSSWSKRRFLTKGWDLLEDFVSNGKWLLDNQGGFRRCGFPVSKLKKVSRTD